MKNVRISFTETEPFNGNMVDRKHSTAWMTEEEATSSSYLLKNNATLVRR